jgi:hypothetical protein
MKNLAEGRRRRSVAARATGLTVVATAAVMLGAGGGMSLASAPLACGDTITADVTLTADLTGCQDNGLVIGADNVTLDLNGHTIGGDGAPFASCQDGVDCDVGVDNSAGHSGLRVTGGSVRGFDTVSPSLYAWGTAPGQG